MGIVSEKRGLDVLPAPTCPAALPIAGAMSVNAGVVCGVVANDRAKSDGIGVTAGQLAVQRRGGFGDTFLSMKRDASSVERLCCGDALPVLDERGHYARDSYTFCPVWQAEKARIEDGRPQMAGGGLLDPEPTEYDAEQDGGAPVGRSSLDDADPWDSALADLELFGDAPGPVFG